MKLLGAALAYAVTASVGMVGTAGPAAAAPAMVTKSLTFTTRDGTVLSASIEGAAPLVPRPLIVEDSPYAPAVSTLSWVGTSYNFIELQWRGTGLSGGALDSTGDEDQGDLSQFLGWACDQPWSNGNIGLYGFSASAIVVYNAMHLSLPCVRAAALMAGTVDLYRDLLDIGGISNVVPGLYVEASIGEPALEDAPTRLQTEPGTSLEALGGFLNAPLDVFANATEDAFWQERTFKGDLDRFPILADTSFYDVEERGPFLAYNATKQYGSHLLVYGAHDGHPAGLPGPFPQYENWFNHYLLGQPLSAANQPSVSLYLSNGSREQFLAGNVTHLTGTVWPLPNTDWTRLYLSSTVSGSAHSLNDGTLSLSPQRTQATQSYGFIGSEPTETDVHTIAVLASDGIDQAAVPFPFLTDMELTEPTSLTYTTPPLKSAVDATGPVGLDVTVSSTAPETDLYAVIADVKPDGTAYPVATGQLRTSYPGIIKPFTLFAAQGDIVDPYTNFSSQDPPAIGESREYHVEILPIGNRFAAGDRIRLYLVGTPLDQLPSPPGLNTLFLGGVTGSRLIFPTVGPGLSFDN
jgi:putative CocE/NonD family hydrolase